MIGVAYFPINTFVEECDNIILKDGKEISAKVLEVTPDLIKYKKCNNSDGPLFSVNKSDVMMIRYSDGTKDIIKDNNYSKVEKKKKVLAKAQKPNSKLEEFQKSSHSIMVGLNTNFDQYYYNMDHIDRTAIGFDLNYSYSLALSSNWRYNSFFTYNHNYERIKISSVGLFAPADPSIPNNSTYSIARNYVFIGQKIGHIHNEMFSTYIGSSIRVYAGLGGGFDDLKVFSEVEERLSFNKTHFIFLNIRTISIQESNLKNSNTLWFYVVEPTIGYGIKL